MEEALSSWATENARFAYSKLVPGFWFAAVTVLFFSLSLIMFSYCRGKKRPAEEANGFFTEFAAIIIMLVWQAFLVFNIPDTTWGMVMLALSSVMAVVSVIYIIRGVIFGIILSFFDLWVSGIILSAYRIIGVCKDAAAIESFQASARIPVAVANDILLMGVLFTVLLLGMATAWLAGRYSTLLCRKKSDLAPEPESEAEDTPASGKTESATGFLISSAKAGAKDAISEGLGNLKKLVIVAVIAAALIVIPTYFSSSVNYFVRGSAQLNNSFVACINEFQKNPGIYENAEFTDRLKASYNELVQFNSRVIDVNTRVVRQADLYFFMLQSDASFQQMLTMRKMYDSAIAGDLESTQAAGNYFDYTNQLMTVALISAQENIAAGSNNLVMSSWYILLDAFRFYTSFIPLTVLAVIFAVLAAILFFLSVRSGEGFPFKPDNDILKPIDALRMPKVSWITLAAVLVLIVGVSAFRGQKPNHINEQDYPQMVSNAFYDSAKEAMQLLALTGRNVGERRWELSTALDRQAQAIDALQSIEAADEAYEAIHPAILEEAEELQGIIARLRTDLESGSIDADTLKEYIELETKLLSQVQNIVIWNTASVISDLL